MIRFEDIEIMPGVVIKNDDPKKIGRIKVSVPLWFTTATMHINAINWVYPMLMQRFQSFSKMELGRTVWVLHERTNYYDFQYIPMFEINDDLKKILETSYNATEVVFTRCKGDVTGQLYFNDDEGIVGRFGNAYMNISAENECILSDETCEIAIKGSQVYLGKASEGNVESAVLGNKLSDLLQDLATGIDEIGQKLESDPYAAAAVAQCSIVSEKLSNAIQNITSNEVFIYPNT